MSDYKTIKSVIDQTAKPRKAKNNDYYFKTEPGQYSHGDKFLGMTMGEQRKIAKQFSAALPYPDIKKLLKSPWHEERMIGLLVLLYRFEAADAKDQKEICDFYLNNRYAVNNWDLVDATTAQIVGRYLLDKPKSDRQFIYKYAKSDNLWERRMAILVTFPFIKAGNFSDIFKLTEKLINDQEDLIHKALGWMLREVGKKDEPALKQFLKAHISNLPRTTLRYAIERFPEPERKKFLYM